LTELGTGMMARMILRAEQTTNDPRRFPFPPAIPVIALLLSWGMQKIWPLELDWPRWARWAGWVLFTTPYLLAAWGVITFRRHHTAVDPLGEVKTVVSSGPFRYTRNPMYLSLILLYLGATLAFRLTWGLLFLIPVFLALHFGVIVPEERHLESKFGSDYAEYKRRVRRWI
jgi:protein-S-isoprenylcysteine O-methyltransferase Ste14